MGRIAPQHHDKWVSPCMRLCVCVFPCAHHAIVLTARVRPCKSVSLCAERIRLAPLLRFCPGSASEQTATLASAAARGAAVGAAGVTCPRQRTHCKRER